jgi:hypothetical protein
VSAGISTIGAGNVSETGVSVEDGIAVVVIVGGIVDEGAGVGVFVGTGVAAGGMDVDEAIAVIAVGGSAVNAAAGDSCGCA